MRIPDEATLQRAGTFAATLGLAVAVYITIADAGGGAPTCLAGGSGCRAVAESSYSHMAGVNVAALGIVGYLVLLGAAMMRGEGGRFVGLAVALVGFGYSVYLTYIEVFKIEALCEWCVASAVLMTVLLAINAMRVIGYAAPEVEPRRRARP